MAKKIAVALNKSFFDTLPPLKKVPAEKAGIAWFIYDLEPITNEEQARYYLKKVDVVYTEFESALLSITTATPGNVDEFVKLLQEKIDEQLETPPNNKTLENPF